MVRLLKAPQLMLLSALFHTIAPSIEMVLLGSEIVKWGGVVEPRDLAL